LGAVAPAATGAPGAGWIGMHASVYIQKGRAPGGPDPIIVTGPRGDLDVAQAAARRDL
jgi:hypothetical protein